MRRLLEKEAHLLLRKIERKEHKLKYLFWEATQRCNLSCLHCGSDCVSASQYPDMPFVDFARVLDSIESPPDEPVMVAITGGEPLLRRDLEECGYAIRERGFKWGMVTNGYHYDADRHRSLLAAGMNSVTVSLDGTRENHNWLRNNPRSFDRALNAIRLIGSASPRLVSDVVSCVNRRNVNELEDIYKIVSESGMPAWRLFTIAPIGRAKDNPEMTLDPAGMTAMMEFIGRKRKEKGISVSFSCEGYVGRYETDVRDSRFFCRAGVNIGSVLIDGSIGACPNIDRVFVQGNIYKDDFAGVWNNRFAPYRNRTWMKTGVCAGCRRFRSCGGNGMHYRASGCGEVAVCHYNLLKRGGG